MRESACTYKTVHNRGSPLIWRRLFWSLLVVACLITQLSLGAGEVPLRPPKSKLVGEFLAIVPGSIVHGLGNAYAGDKNRFHTLVVSEALGIAMITGAVLASPTSNEGTKTAGRGLSLLFLGGLVTFASSWIWDIATTPGAVRQYNAGKAFQSKTWSENLKDTSSNLGRWTKDAWRGIVSPRRIKTMLKVPGHVFSLHARAGILSQPRRLEQGEHQIHLEDRWRRWALMLGWYRDRYHDLTPNAPPRYETNEFEEIVPVIPTGRTHYNWLQWRVGYTVAKIGEYIVLPYGGADIGAVFADAGFFFWPTLKNYAAGIELRGKTFSWYAGIKHVEPVSWSWHAGDSPPRSVTFLTVGIGYHIDFSAPPMAWEKQVL